MEPLVNIQQVGQDGVARLHPPRAGADDGHFAQQLGDEGDGVGRAADAGQRVRTG